MTLDLVGYTVGSPGDFTIFSYADGVENAAKVVYSRPTGGRDPLATVVSGGDAPLWFRVEEVNGKGGTGYWYALKVSVEAE